MKNAVNDYVQKKMSTSIARLLVEFAAGMILHLLLRIIMDLHKIVHG